jgi:serine/threonine-protein kinase RsbW
VESRWTCSRTFPALPAQVKIARAHLRRVLDCWPLTDELLLICSELATNAVLHSQSARPGGQFTIRAEVREGDYLWIEVEDQGGPWMAGQPQDASGRGLAIVAAIADYWDVRGDETGRIVCARMDWPVPDNPGI